MSTKFLKRKKQTKKSEQVHDNDNQNDLPNEREKKEKPEKRRKIRRHAFPIWLRILVVILLAMLSIVVGVIFGYGIIGDGAPLDALKKQTWQHIIDIITKE